MHVSGANNTQAVTNFSVHFSQPPSKSFGADEAWSSSFLGDREQGISQLLDQSCPLEDLLDLKLGADAKGIAPGNHHGGVRLTQWIVLT